MGLCHQVRAREPTTRAPWPPRVGLDHGRRSINATVSFSQRKSTPGVVEDEGCFGDGTDAAGAEVTRCRARQRCLSSAAARSPGTRTPRSGLLWARLPTCNGMVMSGCGRNGPARPHRRGGSRRRPEPEARRERPSTRRAARGRGRRAGRGTVLGHPGDPIAVDQGAVEHHVGQPFTAAAFEHLVQLRRPPGNHVSLWRPGRDLRRPVPTRGSRLPAGQRLSGSCTSLAHGALRRETSVNPQKLQVSTRSGREC